MGRGQNLKTVHSLSIVFRLFDRAVYSGEKQGYTFVLDEGPVEQKIIYPESVLPSPGIQFSVTEPEVPDRIREMRKLYKYVNGSFAEKCRNFYQQGKFMEDYEDDEPWSGEYRRYFPVYHDLNVRQLRGYFTWRTGVRKGVFSPIATSPAYMYLYELLNGIGTDSPEDSLKKMREFENGFLDSGIGDPGMRKNLHRWMLEYAVTHDVSPELARKYADPAVIEKDTALSNLRDPNGSADEELFSALCIFAGKKLEQSQVVRREGAARENICLQQCGVMRRRLTCRMGKIFSQHVSGNRDTIRGIPLPILSTGRNTPIRILIMHWMDAECISAAEVCGREARYDNLYFDRNRFRAFLHETDRRLRRYLKTGHYLHEDPDEAWAAVYVEAVIKAEKQAEIEAARPKITIDISHLEQIRQDALITRNSLLTEEEMPEEEHDAPAEQDETEAVNPAFAALDGQYAQILWMILRGKSPEKYIKINHLMPSVVADTINEAFFDEIGDNVLVCDRDTITIVEDYREDILQILGGKN